MFSQGVFGASENLRIGKWKFFVVMINMFIYVRDGKINNNGY